jgi:hypothetical protein
MPKRLSRRGSRQPARYWFWIRHARPGLAFPDQLLAFWAGPAQSCQRGRPPQRAAASVLWWIRHARLGLAFPDGDQSQLEKINPSTSQRAKLVLHQVLSGHSEMSSGRGVSVAVRAPSKRTYHVIVQCERSPSRVTLFVRSHRSRRAASALAFFNSYPRLPWLRLALIQNNNVTPRRTSEART